MAAITAAMVKDLRAKTDLPMMQCKQALSECDGDFDGAMEWLRKKHKGKMTQRADRATGEGRIGLYISPDGKTGGIIELQCETTPVAGNDLFIDLANSIAKTVAEGSEASPDTADVRKIATVDAAFTEVFGRLQEAMNLGKCRRVEGVHLSSYVHHDGKSGVLLVLDAEPKSSMNVGADLCMHALFSKPLAIDRSGVPAEMVEKVRADAIAMAKSENKPEQIVEKIAEGKVNAFYGEQVLVDQLHIKSDDYGKKKIGDCLKDAGVNAVTDLAIMQVGA